MKALKIALVFILVANLAYSLVGWLSGGYPSDQQQIEQLEQPAPLPALEAAEGFKLEALAGLAKEVRSGQELERRLNEPSSINNLDLNDDEKVDYIQVTEFGNTENKLGFSLYTEPAKGERQEIAEATIEKNGDRAEIQVVGNEQIYGDNAVFNDWAPVERTTQPAPQGEGYPPMYGSYFYPRPLWASPFGYGYYPGYFSPFSLIATSLYLSSMHSYSRTVVVGPSRYQQTSPTKIDNPNKGKTANQGISRSLKKPTGTQKQFQAKAASQKVGKGGFGQRAARPSQLGAGSSRLGQAGQGFGRNNSSVGSSFRGSASRGRSFSFGGK
ncbi:MAG: hypothetical protein A2527_04595 [Candidatus Lambdaproteobacteria bacterium RIFOXYD2_FULL_50_16]|uniref:DUF3300 domain-containing protein n=1 Tax=Candidatus Lambdaproteobacteria bacterium RIFOXYD2_FULL_50_16 TaxID=1817772 RepID=A0A1F6GDJ6_9PROT|nr:MAG: hypothetical protein A2527_04595 [Candidatus Lambdaproteobacteria bacterium RIFOXYD2_FULL_50_16]